MMYTRALAAGLLLAFPLPALAVPSMSVFGQVGTPQSFDAAALPLLSTP